MLVMQNFKEREFWQTCDIAQLMQIKIKLPHVNKNYFHFDF